MIACETLYNHAGKLNFAVQEDAVVRNEYTVEDNENFVAAVYLVANVDVVVLFNLAGVAGLTAVDQGDALSLKLGDGKEHFDGNVNPHFHFICTQCGCVDDIFMPSIDEICTIAAQYYSGNIKGHSTYFYGTCPKCKTKH